MTRNHLWVNFSKGRINIQACAHCGQILLPSNETSQCNSDSDADNPLLARGYKVAEKNEDQVVVA